MDYERVKEAVQRLVAEGGIPTKGRVREQLGGGSYTTLVPAIRQAKIELGLLDAEGIEASTSLPHLHGCLHPEHQGPRTWTCTVPGCIQSRYVGGCTTCTKNVHTEGKRGRGHGGEAA